MSFAFGEEMESLVEGSMKMGDFSMVEKRGREEVWMKMDWGGMDMSAHESNKQNFNTSTFIDESNIEKH